MHVTCITVTYNRPGFLGRAIHCFQQQDDPHARLLVLDDAGQYTDQSGEGWTLVSKKQRYVTLGEKRNDAVRLACEVYPETEGLATWDDDDVYWPHATRAIAAALKKAAWAQASVVYEPEKPAILPARLKRVYTHPPGSPPQRAYGGCFAWRLAVFRTLGGYNDVNNGEDFYLAERAKRSHGAASDFISADYPEPFYLYHRRLPGAHMSDSAEPYKERGQASIKHVPVIPIGWNGPNCYELPVLPGIHPRPF